jgi:uncharacterized protein (TIRG00374 family)
MSRERRIAMSTTPAEASRNVGGIARQVVGYLIAAACLVWVFHGIRGEKLLGEMKNIRWGWVVLAVLFDALSYVCQGFRWRLLLRPSGDISIARATRAIYAGLFTNEIVPFRAGELVRAYLVARWRGVSMLAVIPSMAVERLFDGIWLAAGIGLTAIFVHLPADLLRAADIFGGIVLAATALFLYLVIRKERTLQEPESAREGTRSPMRFLGSLIGRIARGVRDIGMSRYFYLSLFSSSLILIFQILSFWLVMYAYGLRLSLSVGAAVFIIVYFGTALPNAPSNIGTYQFFTVLALTLFGIEKTTAAGFSVAVFIILTVPLWIIGLAAIGGSGMRLKDIRAQISALLSRR